VEVHHLALDLSRTVHHDGKGGIADDIDTAEGFAGWLRDHGFPQVDMREQVVGLRRAIRALFANAVRPDPPAKQDDGLLDAETALRQVNAAAAAVLRAPQLEWPDTVHYDEIPGDPGKRLLAAFARSAIEILSGPDRARLKACPAPRCAKYFVQDHPRQAWCRPSCGNRARVSRYYQRHHEVSTGSDSTP
jgi:predicted RNA-binding Zn ribbon-like protein